MNDEYELSDEERDVYSRCGSANCDGLKNCDICGEDALCGEALCINCKNQEVIDEIFSSPYFDPSHYMPNHW